jgi:hypothetical protein
MAGAAGIRAGRAYVEFGGYTGPLLKDLKAMERSLKTWGSRVTKIGTAGIAAGASVLGPIGAAVASFASRGSDLNDLSAKSGVSTEALQTLGYAAKQNGTDMETLAGGVKKMQKNLFEAKNGSKEAEATFQGLGLSVEDLMKMSPDEQFRTIGDAISKIKNPTERTAAAMRVFGKSGTELLGVMAGGRTELEATEKKFRDLGLVMSAEDVAAADKFGDTMDDVWAIAKRVGDVIGAAVVPILQDFADVAIPVTTAIIQWVNANRPLIQQVAMLGAGLIAGGAALIAFGGTLTLLGMGIGGIVTAATAMGGIIASAFAFAISPAGMLIGSLVSGAAAFSILAGAGTDNLSYLGSRFIDLHTTATSAWQGIVDAVMSGDLALAGQIAVNGVLLEWMKISAPIMGLWDMWTASFRDVWDVATTYLSGIFISMIAGLRSVWHGFIGLIASSLQRLAGVVGLQSSVLLEIEAGAQRGLNSAEKDKRGAQGQLSDDLQARIAARETERIKRQEERQNKINDATADLVAKEKEAADKRAGIVPPEAGKKPESPGNEFSTSDTIKKTSTAVTNSFAAARSGGGAVVIDKIADNTKAAADFLKSIKNDGIPVQVEAEA